MIQISDKDLPITAAEKIIKGAKPFEPSPMMRVLAKAATGEESAADTTDMFTLEEIKEIADYLMVYYNAHQMGIDKRLVLGGHTSGVK